MLHRYRETTFESLPKWVSVGDFLLALHLGRAKGTTWPFITKRYPRSLTEMILDRGRLWSTRFCRWHDTTRSQPITYSPRLILLVLLLWAVFLCWLIDQTVGLTMLMKMVDSR